jgi:hypothetical protein
MPILTDADLRDPSPPLPGDKERAAVAARAYQLGRRRRMMQGAGALGMVAAVAVGVAALTAGGTSGTGTGRIQVANSASSGSGAGADAPNITAAPAPSPSDAGQATDTPAAVPAPAPTPAPSNSGEVAAPTTFTVSGTVANVPPGVTLTLALRGSDGTFTAIADGGGAFSVDGIPPGTYDASYDWTDSTGTATQAGRLGSVTISGDSTVNFSLP